MARPLGLGYLVFIGVVGTAIGIAVFAPDMPRRWMGVPTKPADEGPEPVLPGDMQVSLEAKDHEAALATSVKLAVNKKPVVVTVAAPTVPTEAPKLPIANDKSAALLSETEKAYRDYQFDQATSSARRLLEIAPTPGIALRAKDIITVAPLLKQLFQKLPDHDELSRGYDTNPSLVAITGGRDVTFAVPITGSDKDSPIVDKDPLGFIAAQRKTGRVNFLVKGNKGYIATELPDANIGQVKLVDQVAVRKDKQVQADAYRKTLIGAEGRDPMAWYDLGRFAYQNRLDALVVDSLHQALLLDPKLAATVREDRASVLYANLISHTKNGNKMQAATYMTIIDRKYKDTEQGRQARLYYDGKLAEVIAAAKETQRKADEDEARRREDMKARAAVDGAVVPKVDEEPEAPAAPLTITGSADESKALALYEQGAKFCSDAIDKGNTPERDRLYGEAIKVLAQAVPLLSQLAENEKDPVKREALEGKTVEANKMKYAAIKMRRPH